MGRQTSRIWYQQKDHKEMVTYNGSTPQYHDSAWIWNGSSFELVWKKLYGAMADPIIGVEFGDQFIPYKSGDYYVGHRYNYIYGDIAKIEKDSHTLTPLLEGDYGNLVSFGGIAKDGRMIAIRGNLYVIDIDSSNILLSRPIEVVGNPDDYRSSRDFQATLHHKYMYRDNNRYRYETPTTGEERRSYTSLTDAYLSPINHAGGVGSLCLHIRTISMGSRFQTQYGLRFDTVYPQAATFVEILSMGHPVTAGNINEEEWWSEIIEEKEFPFRTNGGMNFYMDNDHLIVAADEIWNTTTYYICEIPSLDYFEVDVSEIEGANNTGELTVSPSGNTIIYTKQTSEQDHTYKYYKKDKNDEHWEELLCSDASYSYNYTGYRPRVDLVDDSIFFMMRNKTVGQNIINVYQAYKLRQKT